MTWRSARATARRHAAALWRPILVLAAAVAAALHAVDLAGAVVGEAVMEPVGTTLVCVAVVAAGGAVARIVVNVWRAAMQPRRDTAAARRVEDLYAAAASSPNRVLLETCQLRWSALSGQQVQALDTATGAVATYWLRGSAVTAGTLVLVDARAGVGEVLDWAPRETVLAARRFAEKTDRDHRESRGRADRTRQRRERRAARLLVRETERVMRSNVERLR